MNSHTSRPTTRTSLWSPGPARRRVAAVTAATLALSFATVLPAAALPAVTAYAPGRTATDPSFPQYPQGPWGVPGYGRGPGWYSLGTQALDTTTAPEDQENGLVLVASTLADGSGTAAGTGMVIDEDGIVLTNNHVIEGAGSIEVTVATTDATYTARVVGTDSAHDVAVLQLVGADDLDVVTTDPTVATGDEVTAVGDAGGDGGSLTASPGTVTATGQAITVNGEDGATESLGGLIEVDADVISGDSGGALLDADGEVVGMTTAASSGTPDISGYAIPIGTALAVADSLLGSASGA
ncbi:trypsin-like peptidase [Kribbella amoyensis]|uniref:Trypsin-like peptidase n=1 Tax=Kribbella amoyensis TaxID=996641 RepID=A0A561BLG7_9ACTN|nr:trypsin-like peptidase domain-containing protein [Kribbella amoyensis]TWD79741.1 trypsin-like peptidase [Kribbella amoyensis]